MAQAESDPAALDSVSIIGLGRFGAYLATAIAEVYPGEVMGYDVNPDAPPDVHVPRVTFAAAALADVVILAVPLDQYPPVLKELAGLLRRESLLIDICSVKLEPQRLIRDEFLPQHENVLLTHPLFGPLAAARGLDRRTLIVTHHHGAKAERVLAACERHGLEIQQLSAQEHDAHMAKVQALTFFVARGLENLGLRREEIFTPSYEMLMALVDFAEANSDGLFQTIQNGNPFAVEIRDELMASFRQVEAELIGLPEESLSATPYSSAG